MIIGAIEFSTITSSIFYIEIYTINFIILISM